MGCHDPIFFMFHFTIFRKADCFCRQFLHEFNGTLSVSALVVNAGRLALWPLLPWWSSAGYTVAVSFAPVTRKVEQVYCIDYAVIIEIKALAESCFSHGFPPGSCKECKIKWPNIAVFVIITFPTEALGRRSNSYGAITYHDTRDGGSCSLHENHIMKI